jgi:hypothetical protein
MNDLDKNRKIKSQKRNSSEPKSSEISPGKKLETFLILLYQAYLKGETDLEPQIKASILRRVNLNQEFALKIRMIQSDYFDNGRENFQGEWNNELDVLFVVAALKKLKPVSIERQDIIRAYLEEVLKLL